jgi:hypothetical protein
MDNNYKRLTAGFIIAVLVLTAIFLVLPKTGLVITAYLFSLLAPTFLLLMMWKLATGTKAHYITDAAFVIQATRYVVLNIACSTIFVVLEQLDMKISVAVLALFHIILIAVFTWRMLAMDAGQEQILVVEEKVRKYTFNWRMLTADVESIKTNAPAEYHKNIQEVIDKIRYADPMSCPEIAEYEEAIKDNVMLLEHKIQNGTPDEVTVLCLKIQKQIADRNNRLKLFK